VLGDLAVSVGMPDLMDEEVVPVNESTWALPLKVAVGR
jgi:hypothetical protein